MDPFDGLLDILNPEQLTELLRYFYFKRVHPNRRSIIKWMKEKNIEIK